MSLRLRYLKKSSSIYFGLAGMLCIVAGAWILLPKQSAHAEWYGQTSPSVLCAPNTCNTDESLDSIQDVKVKYDSRWQIVNTGDSSGDAERRVLEVANQKNHYMQEVVVGVYITKDVYDAMPANGLKVSFVNRGCNISGDPDWTINIKSPSGATKDLARYDYSTDAAAGDKANAVTFCQTSNAVTFDLSQEKTYFGDYASGALKYLQLSVHLNNYDSTPSGDQKNAQFRIELNDVCGTAECREYVALVKQVGTPNRNYALSSVGASQKKVTNKSSEGGSEYQYFNKNDHSDTYKALREYMEFGLECDANVAQDGKIYIYDVNDGDNSGSETHGWVGGIDRVAVVLQYYDVGSGLWKSVAANYDNVINKWKDADGNPITLNNKIFSDGNDNDTTGIDYDNHGLYALNDGDWPGVIFVPNQGDGLESTIDFKMKTDTRYRIAVVPDHASNFIAVGLPGNQINGLVGCDSFALTPKVTGGTVIGSGSNAQFDNSITSASDSLSDATGIQWRSYGFVTHDGSEPSKQNDYDNLNTICTGLANCGLIGSGSVPLIKPGQTAQNPPESTLASTNGLHYGDKICSFLAISPYAPDRSYWATHPKTWRVSATKCITVTKTPRVQVWGNDTRVGSGFVPLGTVTTSLITTNKGSWGEYGVLAPKGVTTFGSGASSTGTNLTFANTPTIGSFTTSSSVLGTIPDVKTYLVKAGNAPYKAKTGVDTDDRGNADISIAGADTYKANKVYITTGTVTISSDIVNPSTGANLSQMVIIAKDIVIDPNVKQVDAWLVASDMVNTCSAAGSPTVANCGARQLVVNGPIMAKQLLLRRTGGDDANQNSPAETFNLRGDAYIWMRKLSGLTGTVRTVYTRELAPRY